MTLRTASGASGALVALLALTGASEAQAPSRGARDLPTAAMFVAQAQTGRRLALEALQHRSHLDQDVATLQRARALRDAGRRLALLSLIERERLADEATAAFVDARRDLETAAAAAWLQRDSASPAAAARASHYHALMAQASNSARAKRAAEASALAARAAVERLNAEARQAQEAMEALEAHIAQSDREAQAFADAAALASARAEAVAGDPGARGRAAPRLAAALFGPRSAETLLGYGGGRAGVVLAGSQGMQVRAPAAGRVGFSGHVDGYGDVLILELDSGYAIVLSGVFGDRPAPGERFRVGTTLGVLQSSAPVAPELYVEVRRGGRPVDPETAARGWRVAEARETAAGAGSGGDRLGL